jgi:hypothetical protein
VLEVVAGSAADKAGVLPGDAIVGVDDNQIGKKASASRRRLSCHRPLRNCHPHHTIVSARPGQRRTVGHVSLRRAPLFS